MAARGAGCGGAGSALREAGGTLMPQVTAAETKAAMTAVAAITPLRRGGGDASATS